MSAHLDQEVREWVSRYVQGVLSADEFAAWFASVAWARDEDLVDEVALLLAERSNGDLSDDDLRRELADRVGHAEVLAGSLPLSRSLVAASVMGVGISHVHASLSWSGFGRAEPSEPNESALPEKLIGA